MDALSHSQIEPATTDPVFDSVGGASASSAAAAEADPPSFDGFREPPPSFDAAPGSQPPEGGSADRWGCEPRRPLPRADAAAADMSSLYTTFNASTILRTSGLKSSSVRIRWIRSGEPMKPVTWQRAATFFGVM